MRKGKDITSGGTEFFFSIKHEATSTKDANVPKSLKSSNSNNNDVNSLIPAKYLRSEFAPESAGSLFLNRALDRELITARAFHRIIRVSWSIADLHQHQMPTLSDVEEATALHERSFV